MTVTQYVNLWLSFFSRRWVNNEVDTLLCSPCCSMNVLYHIIIVPVSHDYEIMKPVITYFIEPMKLIHPEWHTLSLKNMLHQDNKSNPPFQIISSTLVPSVQSSSSGDSQCELWRVNMCGAAVNVKGSGGEDTESGIWKVWKLFLFRLLYSMCAVLLSRGLQRTWGGNVTGTTPHL